MAANVIRILALCSQKFTALSISYNASKRRVKECFIISTARHTYFVVRCDEGGTGQLWRYLWGNYFTDHIVACSAHSIKFVVKKIRSGGKNEVECAAVANAHGRV